MPSETDVLVLSAADVRELLGIDLAIDSQHRAFESMGKREAMLPARLLIDGADDSVAFCYAARLSPDAGAVCKFGSVNPANAERGLPSISALITVLDPETGRPVAIMDGTTVTTIRTSAASAVAVRALANPDASTLGILGSGVQAGAHVRAVARILVLKSVRVWGPDLAQCTALAEALRGEFDFEVEVCTTAESAVTGADVVACCTTSVDPLIDTAWLTEGATVISVGSFAANRCEVPQELLTGADVVVVDDIDTALEHAGPIVQGVASGLIGRDRLTSLGDVVAGVRPGRTKPSEIVYYNSVGIGVQDAAAAMAVVAAARAAGRGQTVAM
jgi:ornithine cyclodeaminase/alanine dehydrogenase-like protein (mu-crystallin family)